MSKVAQKRMQMEMEMDTVPVGLETHILIFSPLYKHSLTSVCFLLCWALGLLTGREEKKGKPRITSYYHQPIGFFLGDQMGAPYESVQAGGRRHWLLNPSCLSDTVPGTPDWLKARPGARLLFHLCWVVKNQNCILPYLESCS